MEERFLYLGKNYKVEIFLDESIQKDYVEVNQECLQVFVRQTEEERIKQSIKRFYYKECKRLVEKRVRFYQNNFKTKPRAIQISDSLTTWGTCNSRLEMTFNWKLAMAPVEVIDYIVVHEMCHMMHLNHDRSFWRLVGKLLPDYENRQNWLMYFGNRMVI